MEKQEVLDKLKEIGTCENDAERRTLLASLTEVVSEDYDRINNLTTDIEAKSKEIENLQANNMQLYLQVTKSKNDDGDQEDLDDSRNNKRREFKDLFDEKGGIK